MNRYITSARAYLTAHKKEFIIGASVVAGIAILIAIIFGIMKLTAGPKVVYKPANACDLFTQNEAQELMGDNVIASGNQPPALGNDVAMSQCGYTDGNPDKENMLVAAVVVRSGVNDKGVKRNVNEFKESKQNTSTDTVDSVGDDAFFNARLGQLNVLDGKNWIIMSYGVGSEPQANTVEQALKMAEKVVPPAPVTGKF